MAADYSELGHGKLALVVEDSPPNRMIIVSALKDLGFEVESRPQADIAIDEIVSDALVPDVLVCDIHLPGKKNGVDLLRKLKQCFPNVVCIMVTGDPQEEFVTDSISGGARGFIIKPLSSKKIKDQITKLVKL
jgi:CheY-like chemotaxis protein